MGRKVTKKLPAKLTRPELAKVFLRKRLLRALEKCVKGGSVWVCGPPGAGKTTLAASVGSGVPFFEGIHSYALATILIEAGEYAEAERHIARTREIGLLTGSRLLEYVSLLGEAVSFLLRGDEEKALERFSRHIGIGKRSGLRIYAFFRPRTFARLCALALEAGVEKDYVEVVIELNKLQRFSPGPYEGWPWAIRIHTLGRFEAIREGKRVEFPRKAQKMPLELLKALISLGGTDVPEEALTDALWPDSEGDLAVRALSTILHRLRKLIGCEKAVQYSEGRLSIDRELCWVDLWGFSCLLEEVRASRDKARSKKLLERAFNVYRGPFLPGDRSHLSITPREKARSQFLKCAGDLGLFLEGLGLMDEAVDCYRKGIEADCLAEAFYRRIMLCLLRTGDRVEALKTYRRLAATLAENLGVKPSPETEEILSRFNKG